MLKDLYEEACRQNGPVRAFHDFYGIKVKLYDFYYNFSAVTQTDYDHKGISYSDSTPC